MFANTQMVAFVGATVMGQITSQSAMHNNASWTARKHRTWMLVNDARSVGSYTSLSTRVGSSRVAVPAIHTVGSQDKTTHYTETKTQ